MTIRDCFDGNRKNAKVSKASSVAGLLESFKSFSVLGFRFRGFPVKFQQFKETKGVKGSA